MNREPIHSALFTLVQSCASFKVASRILKHWTDVNDADMPAIFQAHKNDVPTYLGKDFPPKWTMNFDLYIYVNTKGDPSVSPAQVMNPILDALETALGGKPNAYTQTLGGLVSHCRIAGQTQTDEGTLGELGVAIVPIEIVVP